MQGRRAHALYTTVYMTLLVVYAALLLVPPAFDWFAGWGYSIFYGTGSTHYVLQQMGVMCLLLAAETLSVFRQDDADITHTYFLRQFIAWVAWWVINAVALSQESIHVALGGACIIVCGWGTVLSGCVLRCSR